jgi:hypothetical protein
MSGWVKTGKAQREQMFSALPLKADVAQPVGMSVLSGKGRNLWIAAL